MFHRLNIHKKLLIGMLIASLLPFAVGIFYIKIKTEQQLYEKNLHESQKMITETAGNFENTVLLAMGNIISILSLDDRLIEVDSHVNNYLGYQPGQFVISDTESERQITRLFQSVLHTYPMVTFVCYGTEFGGYIEAPAFKPTGPYDPRKRQWYISTLSNNGLFISEPYETKMTKERVVSINHTVKEKDTLVGVVGLTISLENILKDFEQVPYGDSGSIIVISPKGTIINNPERPEDNLKPCDSLGIGTLNQLKGFNGASFNARMNGVEKIFTVYVSSNTGWTYIAAINQSEVLEGSKPLSKLLILILVITSLLIIVFVSMMARHITRPVSILTEAIDRMSKFDLNYFEKEKIADFMKSEDEIGEISRALANMQNNFIELKSNLDMMDQEIQNINVEEHGVKQIKLSKSNPLNSIAASVNGLLAKVESYIQRIKSFNEEITLKNEQLSASQQQLISHLKEINRQKELVHFLAEHDPLTDLPNRRSFMERMATTLERRLQGSVILLDIDNFKSINDTLGHIFGDKILKKVAEKLHSLSEEHIFVSRFGGDEFLILIEYTLEEERLEKVIALIYDLFNSLICVDDKKVKVDFSMGISRFPEDSKELNQILMNADLALYTVKNSGKKNHALFHQSMANDLRQRMELKSILENALENDGFKMVYQPKVCLTTGAIIGYEALVRLRKNPISPALFVPIAEENGLIIPMGRVITKMVIAQIEVWRYQGIELKPISINFSALQLHDKGYLDFVFECLEAHDISPEMIQLEFTENIFMDNKELAIDFMTLLRKNGIGIAIDDFGSGYSSLSYIASLPVDTLKFDSEMSLKLLALPEFSALDNLIAFAHSLNLMIVAEGIEDLQDARRLQLAKCDMVQGYCFSKPVEAEEVPLLNELHYEI